MIEEFELLRDEMHSEINNCKGSLEQKYMQAFISLKNHEE
jgi:hypothetical protein